MRNDRQLTRKKRSILLCAKLLKDDRKNGKPNG
jgi:hypothetical protein